MVCVRMEPNITVLWARSRRRRTMQAPQQEARSEGTPWRLAFASAADAPADIYDDDDGILTELPRRKPPALPSTSDTDELRAFRSQWQTYA